MTPLPPIVCTADAARCLGAWPYAEIPSGMRPDDARAYQSRAAERVIASGFMPVITHGAGVVYAMPFHAGARQSGAGL